MKLLKKVLKKTPQRPSSCQISPTQITGSHNEESAYRFLQQHGLTLVERNFRSKTGEIDLIMWDKDCLVFIEVRYRSKNAYGDAADSVNISKQKKLLKTVLFYLTKNKLHDQHPCRIDVVAIDNIHIEWIKNAIQNQV